MIKFVINDKFVDEDTFWEELLRVHAAYPQKLTVDECARELAFDRGCVRLEGKPKTRYEYNYTYFYMADEQVFELEEIVGENEFDPLYGDAFYIAFAIYKKGFRKQQEEQKND